MYVQVGDFRVSRGPPTIPLARILHNAVFFKSQNLCKAGTLCIMIQSLVIMWQCVPLLKRNVCSTEINPPAKIFGTHTSVALRLQASSIFNKTKNRHFCWNSDATQRRYLRQHDGVLFYFLTLQFNIEYENTPIILYGKKCLFLIETNQDLWIMLVK